MIDPTLRSFLPVAGLCLLSFVLGSCSSGGSESNPSKGVTIAADYHLVGLKAFANMSFPVNPDLKAHYWDEGVLTLDGESKFQVRGSGRPNESGLYQIQKNGMFTLLVPISGGASLPLMGGADVEGEALWFTDRHAGGDGDLGLWTCVRSKAKPKPEGTWNVALLTLVFSPKGAAPSPNEVGLAATGTLKIDAKGAVTGTLQESTLAKLTVTGKTSTFPTPPGSTELSLSWKKGTFQVNQAYRGGLGDKLLVGIYHDQKKGGAVSLILGLRAPSKDVQAKDLSGKYLMGTFTLFLDPTRPGCDAAAGNLELNGKDAFRATMWGHTGKAFNFNGSFKMGKGGLVDFQETSPVKIPMWGAVAEGGKVLLMADLNVESVEPDLSIFLAIHEREEKTK